jgi:hypothetical protein
LFLIAVLEEAFIRNMTIIYINYNYVAINNNLWKAPRPYFALQNSHRHAEAFP